MFGEFMAVLALIAFISLIAKLRSNRAPQIQEKNPKIVDLKYNPKTDRWE
jgi:hypothetical protein